MESSPYAAPAAVVDDVRVHSARDMEGCKANRGTRQGAALLDLLISARWMAPIFRGTTMVAGLRQGFKPAAPIAGMMLPGFALLVAMIVVTRVLIHRCGPIVGKRTVDSAIVRSDGDRIDLARCIFLRVVPVSLLGVIPMLGKVAGLVHGLIVFGPERRCLHDRLADTIVIDV